MHLKKYLILIAPFLILTFILFFTLSYEKRFYAFIPVFAFWITYYTWIYIEKKRKDEGK